MSIVFNEDKIMNIPTANSDEEGKYIFVDNEFDYKQSIIFLRTVATANLKTIENDMKNNKINPKRFIERDDKGQLTTEDLFTARGFVKHGLCGVFNKKLGSYDNPYYKCPMLSNNFAQLNQEVFRHVMKMQNITFGCDNKFMCKAYKIKHRLSINYYINDAGAGEDIMNVIRSVKNFIQKI